uniref:(northern house mosquito) hypothetical protein n=1 Tax=Culex pipiens TaxID=7175 RepID=A0A8D8N346_CULPI
MHSVELISKEHSSLTLRLMTTTLGSCSVTRIITNSTLLCGRRTSRHTGRQHHSELQLNREFKSSLSIVARGQARCSVTAYGIPGIRRIKSNCYGKTQGM